MQRSLYPPTYRQPTGYTRTTANSPQYFLVAKTSETCTCPTVFSTFALLKCQISLAPYRTTAAVCRDPSFMAWETC